MNPVGDLIDHLLRGGLVFIVWVGIEPTLQWVFKEVRNDHR